MNFLEIIYLVGAAALGFISGMILELMLDAETKRDLQQQNRKLRLENAQLKEMAHVEVIEINDRTADAEELDFSQEW